MDRKNDNKLSELTMVVKEWNQRNGGHLTSHHIECMTYDYFLKNKPKAREDIRKGRTNYDLDDETKLSISILLDALINPSINLCSSFFEFIIPLSFS